MAKSKSYFGLRRGSTKSHTFSVLRGQQITKDRVEYVANPQTLNQGMSRSIFAAAAKFYSKLKFILDHSFEGVAYGTLSQARFMKLALATKYGTSLVKGAPAEPFNYTISEGSLPSIDAGPQLLPAGGPSGRIASTLKGNLASDSIDAFLSKNSLKYGDNITLVGWSNNKAFAITWTFDIAYLNVEGNNNPIENLVASRIEGELPLNIEGLDAMGELLETSEDGSIRTLHSSYTNGCFVLSRKSSTGSWLRSNARFSQFPDIVSIEGAVSYMKGESGVSVESEYQLNEETPTMNFNVTYTMVRSDGPSGQTALAKPEDQVAFEIVGDNITRPILKVATISVEESTLSVVLQQKSGALRPLHWILEELPGFPRTDASQYMQLGQVSNRDSFVVQQVPSGYVDWENPVLVGIANIFTQTNTGGE